MIDEIFFYNRLQLQNKCHGLTPAVNQAPHSLTPYSVGWQNQKGKSGKNSWVKIDTVKWVKQNSCVQAKQNKEFFPLLTHG